MGLPNYISRRSQKNEKYWIAREFFLKPGVLKASDHGFRSGDKDDYYSDMDILLNDANQCRVIIDIYTDLISKCTEEYQIDFLSFLEKASGGTVGALRLAAALSIETGYQNIIVRPGKTITFEQVKIPRREHSKKEVDEGLERRCTVLITDHCTHGTEVRTAAEILRQNNAVISDIITYTVRFDKFEKEDFEKDKLKLHYAYAMPPFPNCPRTYTELDNIEINL